MFSIPEFELGILPIIKWWEKRRLTYNLVIGLGGAVTFLVIQLLVQFAEGVKDFDWNPLIFPEVDHLIIFAVVANLLFTFCWVVESCFMFVSKKKIRALGGVKVLKWGLIASLALIIAPAWALFSVWVAHSWGGDTPQLLAPPLQKHHQQALAPRQAAVPPVAAPSKVEK